MIRNIPPQYFWPGMVIGILGMSFVANMMLLYKASDGGGPQIIDNYYQKAAHWDDVQAKRAASDALGWKTTFELAPADGGRVVTVRFIDREGAVVRGLKPSITAYDIRKVKAVGQATMREDSGGYTAVLPMNRDGLWDLVLTADHEGSHFEQKKRVDVSR